MAVRAGNLFALDGLGTSGTGIYDAVCKCIWGQEKSITGIWKSSGTLLSVECVVIQGGLRAGECAHTFCMCLYREWLYSVCIIKQIKQHTAGKNGFSTDFIRCIFCFSG